MPYLNDTTIVNLQTIKSNNKILTVKLSSFLNEMKRILFHMNNIRNITI